MGRALILFVIVLYCSQSKKIASPDLLATFSSIGYAPWIPITPDPDEGQPLDKQWQENHE